MITALQIIIGIIMLLLIITTTSKFKKKKINFFTYAFFIIIWLGVALFTFIPSIFGPITKLTNTSPADLAVRLSVIALFYLMFKMNNRLTDMSDSIKKISDGVKEDE